MSVAVKDILRTSRPPGPPGRADKYLPDIAQDLRRLLETFHLRGVPPERALAFLLRCHKGRFYRNRYPSLLLVQSGET
jgi:hypothetical protein